jgi:hypothetical protein
MSLGAFIAMAAQTQAMDWDTVTVNGAPIPPQATVSFSIGYPKGWHAFQDYSQGWHDIYNGNVVAPRNSGPICNFGQMATTHTFREQKITWYSIWPSGEATAKEAAEKIFTDKRTATAHTQKSLKPIKTNAGNAGWLVESESYMPYSPGPPDPAFFKNAKAANQTVQLEAIDKPTQKIPIIYHDFFFHTGTLGAIHIQIMTETGNRSWRSQLDDIVLKTLRFNSP